MGQEGDKPPRLTPLYGSRSYRERRLPGPKIPSEPKGMFPSSRVSLQAIATAHLRRSGGWSQDGRLWWSPTDEKASWRESLCMGGACALVITCTDHRRARLEVMYSGQTNPSRTTTPRSNRREPCYSNTRMHEPEREPPIVQPDPGPGRRANIA